MTRAAILPCLFLLAGCAMLGGSQTPSSFVVAFNRDSANLTPGAQKVVDGIVDQVKQQQPAKVEIIGQTSGTTSKDIQVADQRAQVVQNALTQAGVPANLLQRNPSVQPGGDALSRKVLVVFDK